MSRNVSVLYLTRVQKGLNYFTISNKLLKSGDFETDYEMYRKQLIQAENAKRDQYDSFQRSEQSRDENINAPEAPRFPARLIDDQGEAWELMSDSNDHADYQCRKDGTTTTLWFIHDHVEIPYRWRESG